MMSFIKSIGTFQEEDGTWRLVISRPLKDEQEANEIMGKVSNKSAVEIWKMLSSMEFKQ